VVRRPREEPAAGQRAEHARDGGPLGFASAIGVEHLPRAHELGLRQIGEQSTRVALEEVMREVVSSVEARKEIAAVEADAALGVEEHEQSTGYRRSISGMQGTGVADRGGAYLGDRPQWYSEPARGRSPGAADGRVAQAGRSGGHRC
jgi:hypothetical protein